VESMLFRCPPLSHLPYLNFQLLEWLKQWIYSTITYYWTLPLILDHSYLIGNFTNSKIAETKDLEPLKSRHFCISNIQTC
jgi:hypothetical protein